MRGVLDAKVAPVNGGSRSFQPRLASHWTTGADVAAADGEGRTPVHYAVTRNALGPLALMLGHAPG